MRFIRVDNTHVPSTNHTANLQTSGKAPAVQGNTMHGDAHVLRPHCQKGILNGNQFGSVTPRKQSLQKQESLVLSSAIIPAEIDDQRAHAQASPGFGHERCVSFSPASSRPSFRYFI